MITEHAIGQDSHRFAPEYDPSRPLVLGGFRTDVPLTLEANSDGDVILHALTNALSGITCKNILGPVADGMCRGGITDSAEYLKLALEDLEEAGYRLVRVSFSIEAQKPRFLTLIPGIRESVSGLCHLSPGRVGITATSGEGLSSCGRGEGIQVFCSVTVAGGHS